MIDVRVERARKLRKDGWRYADIAKEVGVCKRTVGRWLVEKKVPRGYNPQTKAPHHRNHDAVKRLFAEAAAQQCQLRGLARKAGLPITTLTRWKQGLTKPNVYDLEAALNVLGLGLGVREL